MFLFGMFAGEMVFDGNTPFYALYEAWDKRLYPYEILIFLKI
jgi:hypothetical protein